MVRLLRLCVSDSAQSITGRKMSRRTHKSEVQLILVIFAVILESFCSFTLSLAIPTDSSAPQPHLSLASEPLDEYRAPPGSVDAVDKERPAERSDLNDDHNRISHDENSLSADIAIIAIAGVELVDAQERRPGAQDTHLYSVVASEPQSENGDKEIDGAHTVTPERAPPPQSTQPVRWSLRPSSSSTTSSDNAIIELPSGVLVGRTDNNNGQTNSLDDASSGEGLSAEVTTILPEEEDNAAGEEVEELVGQERKAGGECILGSSDVYLAWWINNDGSLRKVQPDNPYQAGEEEITVSNFIDLSGMGRSEGSLFYKLVTRLNEKRNGPKYIPIKFLSLARNNLERAPYSTLNLIGNTLEYLSMAGNNFGMLNASIIKDDLSKWATFPMLELLKELDLRSCKIAVINADAFSEMQMLQKMYLSDNNLISLSAQIFSSVRSLIHLDLSYNSIEYTMTNFYTNPFEWFTRGLEIDEFAFSDLTQLKFLDFSHTRLEPSSMKSFAYLPSKLEQLSLCYTAISVIGLGMFHSLPNLKVLDLSGNSALTGNMNRNTFDGLQNSLEILAFENSSVKHLDWLGNLSSLKMLKLNDNNINQLSRTTFERLPSLDVLDLSFNHIGNWFSRVFESNLVLRIVNLRSNNINVITTEMMSDFSQLQYLGLANNNFICNCMLRDLIDQALQNTHTATGQGFAEEMPNINDLMITQVLTNYLNNIGLGPREGAPQRDSSEKSYDYYARVLRSYVVKGVQSYKRIRTSTILLPVNAGTVTRREQVRNLNQTAITAALTKKFRARKRYVLKSQLEQWQLKKQQLQHRLGRNKSDRTKRSAEDTEVAPEALAGEDALPYLSQEMDFDFQLLDFDEEHYTCFNATTNEEYFFTELESCLMERVASWQHLVQQLRPHQRRISVALYIIFVAMVVICITYYKWWYIRYFFILIKNATILSFLNKESQDNGSRKSFGEISRSELYLYDVFVSYCDENRDWVINELLPNLEQRQEISICLHERDFLVGLSILENIIACMDRSKCLLLVVSQSFLLSQWCQFEMHLAQHRLLETCRERLVLILLEDIPKRKRPKTLGYLMKTKTYIKWPLERSETEHSRVVAEERKVFWKRLRRALIETDWESDANT